MIAPSTQPLSGAQVYREAARAGLRPDPRLTITEWADERRYISQKASPEPGKYRSDRTPYVREIQDALSPFDPTQDITFMKGTQLGGTEIGNNWIGYTMDVCPAPMIMGLPTVELAKDHSQQKLDSMIADTPVLRGRIKERRSRDSGNTTRAKEFPGGILFLIGANSPAGFRSKSIRNVFEDDVDGWPPSVGEEGDPAALIEKRTDTYSSRKKIFRVSTPTIRGRSRVEAAFNQSDQRYYYVPCPHCGHVQPLEWGGPDATFGIKFARNAAGTVVDAWYICDTCHARIDEHHKTQMLAFGRWVATHPERAKRGYHLSSLYSPLGWVSWMQICQEFIDCGHDKEKLKTWTNTRLAQTFEEIGDQPDWAILKARCEQYEMLSVPAGGMLITGSVDTQDDRLEVLIKAWGRGEETWNVFHTVLWGDPNNPTGSPGSPWTELDRLLTRSYQRTDGAMMKIVSMGIDSGGHRTQAVYNYCRMRYPIVFALQGSSSRGKPVLNAPKDVDVLWNGQKIPGGCKLWTIGTDTAKSTIYSRVRQTIPGPGCYHWPIGTTDDYFLQLTAEKLVETHNKKGFTVAEWVKVRERNEALDLEVYNYAAALRAGVNWVLGPASPTPTPTAPKPAASSPSAQPVPADNDRPEILQLRVKTPEPLDRITEHHQRPTHSRRYERPNWLNR